MTRWHSLYLSSDNHYKITDLIQNFFDARDYHTYNPFDGLPGISYPQTIKLFLAPPAKKWSRILVDSSTDLAQIDLLCEAFSHEFDCLSVMLEGNISTVHGYQDGYIIPIERWMKHHRKNSSVDSHALLNVEEFILPPLSQGQVGDVPLDQLSPDLQAMAQQINAKDAESMFQKLSKKFIKTIGRKDVSELMNTQPNWDSQGGQYIRTLMDALTIPSNWRVPDFATVRSAYTIEMQPSSRLSATDTTLDVPSITMYQPIYGGKY